MDTTVKKEEGVLLAAYGTLRPGWGNYRALIEGRAEHLGTFKTKPKYTMYGKFSGFPIVRDFGTTEIVYDLFRIDDKRVVDRINQLEGCTGVQGDPRNWYDVEYIDTPFGEAMMYVQHKELRPENIIESGDWNEKLREKY